MNALLSRVALLTLTTATLGLTACSDDSADTNAVAPALQVQTASNLAPAVGSATGTGQPSTPKHHAFYNLATNKEVSYTDSASTKWDIAVRGTDILVNGGTSGPGKGSAQVVDGLFTEITEAPPTGYKQDAGTAKAIPKGSGNGWYNYNSTTHIITPLAGKVIMLQTAEGKYAKMEVVSYYKDAPAAPTATSPTGYTFRYLYQPDGSRNLK
ncbi:HmuY family protein [Hymenobacter aerilatus]|uniref:HmuY family protein n=1 Tax=Hymenobacter aerilatus TaxID=2932251 RepID=A0A8T9T181_9BACT|nr:HmuY family protein [Hymenobacter aerilatus]UOR06300.1 HmuY family protein [Hymenobacter aerilatus]